MHGFWRWALALWFCLALPAQAQTLLELRRPGVAPVLLDRDALTALPQVTLRTHTEFTDGLVEFTGPTVRSVLALIDRGASTTARMVALNDYAVEIPLSDFERFGVILALSMNGVTLTPRDKGPIWVMYPISDVPELDDPLYNSRMIWQLSVIELK